MVPMNIYEVGKQVTVVVLAGVIVMVMMGEQTVSLPPRDLEPHEPVSTQQVPYYADRPVAANTASASSTSGAQYTVTIR